MNTHNHDKINSARLASWIAWLGNIRPLGCVWLLHFHFFPNSVAPGVMLILSPKWLWDLAPPLHCCPGFPCLLPGPLPQLPNCFLGSWSCSLTSLPSTLPPWGAFPKPHITMVFSHLLKILPWVFLALKRKSTLPSMVFKVFVVSWISLHDLCFPPTSCSSSTPDILTYLQFPELATFPQSAALCLARLSFVSPFSLGTSLFFPPSCLPIWLPPTYPVRCNLSTAPAWKLAKTHPPDLRYCRCHRPPCTPCIPHHCTSPLTVTAALSSVSAIWQVAPWQEELILVPCMAPSMLQTYNNILWTHWDSCSWTMETKSYIISSERKLMRRHCLAHRITWRSKSLVEP